MIERKIELVLTTEGVDDQTSHLQSADFLRHFSAHRPEPLPPYHVARTMSGDACFWT